MNMYMKAMNSELSVLSTWFDWSSSLQEAYIFHEGLLIAVMSECIPFCSLVMCCKSGRQFEEYYHARRAGEKYKWVVTLWIQTC